MTVSTFLFALFVFFVSAGSFAYVDELDYSVSWVYLQGASESENSLLIIKKIQDAIPTGFFKQDLEDKIDSMNSESIVIIVDAGDYLTFNFCVELRTGIHSVVELSLAESGDTLSLPGKLELDCSSVVANDGMIVPMLPHLPGYSTDNSPDALFYLLERKSQAETADFFDAEQPSYTLSSSFFPWSDDTDKKKRYLPNTEKSELPVLALLSYAVNDLSGLSSFFPFSVEDDDGLSVRLVYGDGREQILRLSPDQRKELLEFYQLSPKAGLNENMIWYLMAQGEIEVHSHDVISLKELLDIKVVSRISHKLDYYAHQLAESPPGILTYGPKKQGAKARVSGNGSGSNAAGSRQSRARNLGSDSSWTSSGSGGGGLPPERPSDYTRKSNHYDEAALESGDMNASKRKEANTGQSVGYSYVKQRPPFDYNRPVARRSSTTKQEPETGDSYDTIMHHSLSSSSPSTDAQGDKSKELRKIWQDITSLQNRLSALLDDKQSNQDSDSNEKDTLFSMEMEENDSLPPLVAKNRDQESDEDEQAPPVPPRSASKSRSLMGMAQPQSQTPTTEPELDLFDSNEPKYEGVSNSEFAELAKRNAKLAELPKLNDPGASCRTPKRSSFFSPSNSACFVDSSQNHDYEIPLDRSGQFYGNPSAPAAGRQHFSNSLQALSGVQTDSDSVLTIDYDSIALSFTKLKSAVNNGLAPKLLHGLTRQLAEVIASQLASLTEDWQIRLISSMKPEVSPQFHDQEFIVEAMLEHPQVAREINSEYKQFYRELFRRFSIEDGEDILKSSRAIDPILVYTLQIKADADLRPRVNTVALGMAVISLMEIFVRSGNPDVSSNAVYKETVMHVYSSLQVRDLELKERFGGIMFRLDSSLRRFIKKHKTVLYRSLWFSAGTLSNYLYSKKNLP